MNRNILFAKEKVIQNGILPQKIYLKISELKREVKPLLVLQKQWQNNGDKFDFL